METRRICPKCRKRFSRDEVVCEDCGEQLIDAASDFEASFSMVKEPVLLSNGHDVDTVYLEEALKAANVPYYVEEGQNTVPTNRFKEGIVEVVPFTNYYVDKSNWKAAREALKSAGEETRKDQAAPVVFLDMPEEGTGDDLGNDASDGSDSWTDGEESRGGLWEWLGAVSYTHLDVYKRQDCFPQCRTPGSRPWKAGGWQGRMWLRCLPAVQTQR